MSYQPKTYRENGGDQIVIASGGSINVESGGAVTAAGTQAAHIANASVAYATPGLDTEAEVIAAFNTTNGKINSILAALRGAGIIASS